MKKILSAVFCAAIMFILTSCTNREEKAMLKPEIKIGDTTVELPCALKDIKNIIVDEEEIIEFDYDGIDAVSVTIYWDGSLTALVTLDNRDKNLPLEEKPIAEINLFSNTEFHGIRLLESKWEDTCEIIGKPGSKIYGNFLVPLENGYYLDCRKSFDEGTVSEMTVFRVFNSEEEYRNVR